MPTQNLAIMFTDIKGFTARVSSGKRDDLKHLLSTHQRLLEPVITHYDGTIVKTIGDSFLARFDSPTDAVLCGVAIQEVLRQHNAFATEAEHLDVRVAINSGDVEIIAGDVMGEAVNLASRLEGIAEAGEVYFTEAVYLAMNRREAPSTEIGERTFAGIPYPVRVFKVVRDPDSDLARKVAAGVRLTDQGPVFKGLRDSQPVSHHLRWAWAVAALALALPVGVWIYRATASKTEVRKEALSRQEQGAIPGKNAESGNLRAKATPEATPSTSVPAKDTPREKAASTAKTLAPVKSASESTPAKTVPATSVPPTTTTPAAAPMTVTPETKADPVGDGRRRLDDLAKSQGASAALDWLRKRLDQDPALDPLRDEIPVLDARATGEYIVQKSLRGKEMADAAAELLARYPKSAAAALELARSLEGKVVPAYYPVVLYDAAIKRGANARDPHILEFCLGLLPHYWPGWLDATHDLLQRYYDTEALAWAQRTADQEESGVSLSNAWRILKRHNDPRLADPYYQAVMRATQGYSNDAEADRDLAVFRQVTDRGQQKHVLSVYRWVFDDNKAVSSFGYSRTDLAKRNLAALESLWGKQ